MKYSTLLAQLIITTKRILISCLIFLLVSCQPTDKSYIIHGNACKLWLLFDKSISESGHTLFVICFDRDYYQCYRLHSNGSLRKTGTSDGRVDLLGSGIWKYEKDTLSINKHYISSGDRINEDTIKIIEGIYMLNITNKYFIDECSSKNLVAYFKGGKVDSIEQILNYRE